MSNAVRLSSRLSKDEETNGLDSLAARLKEDPDTVICAIAWFRVSKITTDVEEHFTYPTVELKRVEPIGAVDAVPQAVIDLAAELYEDRLNRSPLPFGTVETIEGGYTLPAAESGGEK